MAETREVFPGDEVAVEEEYLASDGTFAKDGKIYASQIGTLELNDEECVARVISPNPPNILKTGDIVYAIVQDIRNRERYMFRPRIFMFRSSATHMVRNSAAG